MHGALTTFALTLTLVCAACAGGQISLQSGGVPLQHRMGTAWDDEWPSGLSGSGLLGRPTLVCDAFGRCERVGPANVGPGFRHLYGGPWAARPSFRYDLDRGGDRFVRTGSDVRCDRATRICYKDGRLDKSETQDAFGERAGDRADGLRDSVGTAHVFVTKRGAACDRERRVCFSDGEPDRRVTERHFGRRGKKNRD